MSNEWSADGKQPIGRNPGPEEEPPMSEQQNQTPDPVDLPESKEPDLAYGYVVGVNKEGGFVFNLLGDDKGIVQLLGLNKFAEKQIETLADSSLNQGLPLVLNALGQIYQKIEELGNEQVPLNNSLKLDE